MFTFVQHASTFFPLKFPDDMCLLCLTNCLLLASSCFLASRSLSLAHSLARSLNLQVTWEYRGQDGGVHGPFSGVQVRGWVRAGFFSGERAVLMRRAVATSTSISRAGAEAAVSRTPGGGYEESKTSEHAKRRRGEGEGARKRSRGEEGGSGVSAAQELLDDLADSDNEEEEEKEEDAGGAEGVGGARGEEDLFAQWQSSDDIDWALLGEEGEEGRQMRLVGAAGTWLAGRGHARSSINVWYVLCMRRRVCVGWLKSVRAVQHRQWPVTSAV